MASFEHVTFLLVVMSMTSLILAKQISFQATPNSMQTGLTRDLCINCNYVPESRSNLNVILSVIISKDSGDDHFEELAGATSSSQNNLFIKDTLGANVTGSIQQGQRSYLSFCWLYPSDRVPGEYRCDVAGVDTFGHPVSVSSMSEIRNTTVNNGVLLDKLREVEIQLYNQNKELLDTNNKIQNLANSTSKDNAQLQIQLSDLQNVSNNQKSQLLSQEGQLNLIMSRVEKSRAAVTEHSTSFQDHKYHLTRQLWQNTAMVDSMCALYGGYLAEIDNHFEYDFIQGFLKNNSVSGQVLISGTKEGHPTWTYERSGQNVTYFNWAPSEPGSNPCISLSSGGDFKMYDIVCRNSAWVRFLCEVPL